MANEKQTAPTQLDIEMNNLDRAARAVRDYQKGAATRSYVRDALLKIDPKNLKAISIATRVSLEGLEHLRGEA